MFTRDGIQVYCGTSDKEPSKINTLQVYQVIPIIECMTLIQPLSHLIHSRLTKSNSICDFLGKRRKFIPQRLA